MRALDGLRSELDVPCDDDRILRDVLLERVPDDDVVPLKDRVGVIPHHATASHAHHDRLVIRVGVQLAWHSLLVPEVDVVLSEVRSRDGRNAGDYEISGNKRTAGGSPGRIHLLK